jgi:hypothetical protein
MVVKADAIQILHVSEQEYAAVVADKNNGLKTLRNGEFVTRASLEAFLGLQRKKDK